MSEVYLERFKISGSVRTMLDLDIVHRDSRTVDLRRTTVTASRSSLDTLEAEARRRGVTLTAVLAEAIDEKADTLHVSRRPRVGIARSTDGRSAAELTAEPVAHPPS
jgi:predicted DNA-binding ribbon-helix-helix protein